MAFTVDDYAAAHAHHEEMGVICYENPSMGIYFIEDPDGYWLEILLKMLRSRIGFRFRLLTLNLWTVVVLYVCPGSRMVDGKFGWFGESREMLRLEAEGEVLLIGLPALADDRPVQEVAGVELDAGLVRPDLQHAAALRILDPGRQGRRSAAASQDEVVVVAALDLGDPLADGVRRGEVEGRPGDRRDLARRDQFAAESTGVIRVGLELRTWPRTSPALRP